MKFIMTLLIAALVSGCAATAQVNFQTTVVKSNYAEEDAFIALVDIVRKYMHTRPPEDVLKHVEKLIQVSRLKKECEGKRCFLAIRNKEILITPDYIEVRSKGSNEFLRITNMNYALSIIYRV